MTMVHSTMTQCNLLAILLLLANGSAARKPRGRQLRMKGMGMNKSSMMGMSLSKSSMMGMSKSSKCGKSKSHRGRGCDDGGPKTVDFVTPASQTIVDDIVIQLWDIVQCPPLVTRAKLEPTTPSTYNYGERRTAQRFLGASCDRAPFATIQSINVGHRCPQEAAKSTPQPVLRDRGSIVCCAANFVKSHARLRTLYPSRRLRQLGSSSSSSGGTCPSDRAAILAGNSTVYDPYVDTIRYGPKTDLDDDFTLHLFTSIPYFEASLSYSSLPYPQPGASCSDYVEYPFMSTQPLPMFWQQGGDPYTAYDVSPTCSSKLLIGCDGEESDTIVSVITLEYDDGTDWVY